MGVINTVSTSYIHTKKVQQGGTDKVEDEKRVHTGVDDGGGHVKVGVAGDDDEGDAQHRRQGGAVGRCGGVGHVEGEVVGAALRIVVWCDGSD